MNDSIYRISLEVQQLQLGKIFYAKKGDTARRLEITLTDGGLPYRIADGCQAILTATKPNGLKFYSECQISGDTIIYEAEDSFTDTPGEMLCEVTVFYGEKQITGASFGMVVEDRVYNDGDVVEQPKTTRALLSPMGATVGQYLRITSVDEQGRVTGLEAVELSLTKSVASISVTEVSDGTVSMVNTLEDGSTEAIVISSDAEGNPNKLTYNGTEIPISWAVS